MKNGYVIRAIFFLCAVLWLGGCNPRAGRLELAYELAGENGAALKQVLEHYRNAPQKQQAARFLLENMLHQSYTGDAIGKYREAVMSWPEATIPFDSLWNETNLRAGTGNRSVFDAAILRPEDLIRNIDGAFSTWETSPWHAEIDFDTFCRYILPFRVSDEPLSDWREALKKEYEPLIAGERDPKRAFGIVYRHVIRNFLERTHQYPYTPDVMLLDRQKEGICAHRCIYLIAVLRALGIPASYDLVYFWANYSQGGHSWVAYVDNDGRTYTMNEPDSLPGEFNPIDASFAGVGARNLAHFRYSLDSLKRVSKVFRKSYAVQGSLKTLSDENIPAFFRDIFTTDVSESYGLNGQVDIEAGKAEDAYLYTFASIKNWQPAARSRSKGGAARFSRIGKNIAYLPVRMENGEPVPIENPFSLTDGNEKIQWDPVTDSLRTITLWRKYILYSRWVQRWEKIVRGRIEVSDFPDFRQAELLHEFSAIPDGITRVSFVPSRPYRYLRFQAPDDGRPDVAEMRFYGRTPQGDTVPLLGDIISRDITREYAATVFDNDYSTYTQTPYDHYWFGLDLGADNRAEVVALEFCLRHDMNIIEVGDDYELFYYDLGWRSLGRRTADADSLVYSNAPRNALFWLRNHTKGREERIFTYENGKQVWW